MVKVLEKKPGCIQCALDVVGDKWTALLVRDMSDNPKTFSELEISLIGISPRTLSHRLDKLESDKVVERTKYNSHPPRYKYQLTKKGQELRSIVVQMANWGARYK